MWKILTHLYKFQLEAVGDMYGFDGKNRYAHAGMLKSALGIRAELEANDVLGRIFGGHDSTLKTPLREVRSAIFFHAPCFFYFFA